MKLAYFYNFIRQILKVAIHMRYLAKTKSCTALYCYLLNSGLIDTHIKNVPNTYSCWEWRMLLAWINRNKTSLLINRPYYHLSLMNTTCMCGALFRAVLHQAFVHFDVLKILTFLGITNIEPNLLSLGRALCYTLYVICQIFTKCHVYVATFNLWSKSTYFFDE